MALYVTMLCGWAVFFKTMTIFSTVEITLGNIFNLFGIIFIASNFYAAEFAVAH